MRAHGRIDPAFAALTLTYDIEKLLAHSMKPLKFKTLRTVAHLQNCSHGMRIMRRELRINPIGHGEKFARASQIRNVRRGLAGEDRKTVKPVDLGALDLGIPVSAFHQPHHHAAVKASGEFVDVIYDRRGAQAIGLDHHTEPVPSGQFRVGKDRVDHVQRQLQPVGFLGVDVEADIQGGR